uniref:Glucagon-1 n=2 Tax=Petromyzon marinus TaxID=7757 RepID=A0AAJ7SYV9_PETMA|nr:glucagon-1 [Petromyzon marinus]
MVLPVETMSDAGFLAAPVLLLLLVSLASASLEQAASRDDDSAERPLSKRHSEGTFTSDYSKYLENKQAKDFVRWLMNAKRGGSELQRRHADGTFTNDMTSYLDAKAARDFVSWLARSDKSRRDGGDHLAENSEDKRHAEDVNALLDRTMAKTFIEWLEKQNSNDQARAEQTMNKPSWRGQARQSSVRAYRIWPKSVFFIARPFEPLAAPRGL